MHRGTEPDKGDGTRRAKEVGGKPRVTV